MNWPPLPSGEAQDGRIEVIRILAIDHIVLRTPNVDRLVAFYSEVLGCAVERRSDSDTGLTQLRAGDALIDLVAVDSRLGRSGGDAPGATGRNLDHFCLQIAPATQADVTSHLRKHGVESGEWQRRYGAEGFGESVYIEDPDGNVVELRCRQSPGESRT